ncbi:MAG TPA: hypothetical protein VHL10_01730 [Nitrososphaera sp.]|jgi:hypothetical protein|nr:hypothetical protein [Nitrososphaera sp.]
MEDQNDVLDQMAMTTVTGAKELMHWFRQEGYSNTVAFCIMTHTLATMWQSMPTPGVVKDLAMRVSKRIFMACNGPLAAVVTKEEVQ